MLALTQDGGYPVIGMDTHVNKKSLGFLDICFKISMIFLSSLYFWKKPNPYISNEVEFSCFLLLKQFCKMQP